MQTGKGIPAMPAVLLNTTETKCVKQILILQIVRKLVFDLFFVVIMMLGNKSCWESLFYSPP